MPRPPEINTSIEPGIPPLPDQPAEIAETCLPQATLAELEQGVLLGGNTDTVRPDITAPPTRTAVSLHVGAPILEQATTYTDNPTHARDATNKADPSDGPATSAEHAPEQASDEPATSTGDSGKKPPVDGPPPAAETPQPDDGEPIRWGRGEAQEAFKQAVTNLREQGIDPATLVTNPITKAIITGYVDEGKTVEQICQETGKSVAYVSQLIGRGVEAMRRNAPEEARHLVPQPTGKMAERFTGNTPELQAARAARAEIRRARAAEVAHETRVPEAPNDAPRSEAEQLPDLRDVIPAAQTGDAAAERTLFDLTRKIINHRLAPYSESGSIDTENMAGEIQARLAAYPFDASRPIQAIDATETALVVYKRYASYVSKVARSIVADHFRQQSEITQDVTDRTGTPVQHLERSRPEELPGRIQLTSIMPEERISSVMGSELQQRVFDARTAGKSNAEIAAELTAEGRPMTTGDVKSLVYRARTNLERQILEPAGLKPVRGHERSAFVRQLIRNHEVSCVNVLGVDYVKDDWIPPNLAEQGYVLLKDIATNAEATTFRYLHPDKIHKQLGRLRVSPDDLPHLLDVKIRKQAEHGKLQPPEEGYVALPNLIRSPADAIALAKGLEQGELTNPIRTSKAVFIRADQAKALLDALRRRQ